MDPTDASAVTAARAQQKRRRLWTRGLILLVMSLWAAVALYHSNKPLPPGTRIVGAWTPTPEQDLRLLIDTTTADAYGRPIVQQQIFDEILRIIGAARTGIVLDMFLFNPRGSVFGPREAPVESGAMPANRELSRELRDALLDARRRNPALRILVITDPVNDAYGDAPSADFALLEQAGITVVRTDLDALRDSNPAYSALWRLGIHWWSDSAWATLLNIKANHRKVLLADDGANQLVGVVGSLNAHDASSLHSNIALAVRGAALLPLLDSELSIARFSGLRDTSGFALLASATSPVPNATPAETPRVQVLTEGAIRDALLTRLETARNGDAIDIAMFYLAERRIVRALLAAAARGVAVRLILDPNKDAFGREKHGLPTRPLAAELNSASQGAIRIRWYRTRGEQFHTKLVSVRTGNRLWFTLGSANLTRRNINDYTLEANIAVELAADGRIAGELTRWFDTLWFNRGPVGTEYTADLGTYVDTSQGSYWAYRIMESTGLSSF